MATGSMTSATAYTGWFAALVDESAGNVLADVRFADYPFVGKLMANGLAAADRVVIPTDASPDGARGVDAISESVILARRSFNERLEVAAIVIGRRERNGEQDFREQELRSKYEALVAKTVIPKRAAVVDAHGLAVPITTLKGSGAFAVTSAYRDLALELNLI